MSFADAYGGGGSGAGPSGGGGGRTELDELSAESKKVGGAIFQMQTQVSSFKRMVDALGTSKDTRELRAKLNKQRELIGGMAKEASLAVKRMAQTVHDADSSGDARRAKHVAQHQKLVKDFHAVLKEFQKAQRTCAERESTFLPQKEVSRSGYGASDDEMRPPGSGGGSGGGFGKSEEKQALLMDSRRQELVRNEGEMEFNNALIEEREQGILEIQQQIGEVNEIFQDLAVLVNEQGQMIDDIEANIVSTAVRTKDAQRELTKADKSQKAARNKMICLAIAIAVVLIVLILFLLN
jgi:syntaxin 7